MSEDWIIGIIVTIILVVLNFNKEITESKYYQQIKGKITGVEYVDKRIEDRNYNSNTINYSNEVEAIIAVKSKFRDFNKNNIQIKSITKVTFYNNYKNFSMFGFNGQERDVEIRGTIKKKNGKYSIKHKSVTVY